MSRQKQALIITCLIFSPLLYFVAFADIFRVEMKGEDSISLAMEQFIAQGQLVQSAKNPIPAPHREKKKHHKKQHKKERKVLAEHGLKKEERREEKQSSEAGGAQVANNAPTQIGTMAAGRDDNPFLREVKRAIDKAARESYPRQAVRMRLMGEVLVEFVWMTDKRLHGVRILRSSGHELLDHNIFKVLARASKEFPPYKENIRIQIPVVYNIR